MVKRTGITFHRTFRLNRVAIAQLLRVAVTYRGGKQNSCPTRKVFREKTQLGSIYIEAMPRYARVSGLLDDRNCLTPFGAAVARSDLLQENKQTQWLMHYHLSSSSGGGPSFWRATVSAFFLSGNTFSRKDVEDHLYAFVEENEKRILSPRDAKTTSRVFLDTYTKEDSLGKLGVLKKISDDEYLVQHPDLPSIWAFAYALIHYWKATFGERRLTVNLDELTARGGLGSIFLIGKGRMNVLLQRLQRNGVVDIFNVSPPYQVVLQQTDEQAILERLYEEDENL